MGNQHIHNVVKHSLLDVCHGERINQQQCEAQPPECLSWKTKEIKVTKVWSYLAEDVQHGLLDVCHGCNEPQLLQARRQIVTNNFRQCLNVPMQLQ